MTDESYDEGYKNERKSLEEELAALKPTTKPAHRSILEIARERNWKRLPDHIRQAERDSRMPSARSTPDPYWSSMEGGTK